MPADIVPSERNAIDPERPARALPTAVTLSRECSETLASSSRRLSGSGSNDTTLPLLPTLVARLCVDIPAWAPASQMMSPGCGSCQRNMRLTSLPRVSRECKTACDCG